MKNARFRIRRSLFGSAVVLVIVAGSLASVGGISSATAKLAKSPIKIMLIASIQSTVISFPNTANGAQAAAKAINAKGGINGHRIDIIVCNDQANPDVAETCARQAVSDHVSATTSGTVLTSNVFLPILQAAGIPNIGENIQQSADLTNPINFPIDSGAYADYIASAEALVASGCKEVGAVRLDVAATAGQVSEAESGVTTAGGTVTTNIAVPANQPSFSGIVQSEINAGSCGVIAVMASNQVEGLVSAIQQSSDPTMKVVGALVGLPVTDLKSMGTVADGDIVAQPSYAPNTPQAKPFVDDMIKYGGGASLADGYAEGAWSAIEAFAKVTKNLTNFSSSSVRKALHSATAISIPTYPKPLDFAKANPAKGYQRLLNPWVVVYEIVNGSTLKQLPDSPLNIESGVENFVNSSS